jgi:hypothetical protein
MSQEATKGSKKDCPLDQVLSLATKTAKGELGTTPANKKVTATATLATSVTENSITSDEAVNASVSLGVSSSSGPAKSECCCEAKGLKASCCCATPAK